MLVKKSIVEKWYQTDSWVYKNFAYLFQNPLWSKNIPRGFSVCPYFWLSLFSILFRFCFVAPIQYVAVPIVKALGKPAKVVDGWCGKLLNKIGISNRLDAVGSNLFLTVLLIIVAFAIGVLLTFGVVKLVALYAYLEGLRLGMFAFWSILSFAGMWLTLFIHQISTDTECKTMNYLWVWLVLFFIASGIFIPTEILHGTAVLFTTIAQVLWAVLCMIGAGVAKLGSWIAIAAVWTAKVVWSGIWWKPLAALILPWWGFIAILCVMGWAFDKFCTWMEQRNTETLLQTDPAELYARYRATWLSVFQRVLTLSEHYKEGKCFGDGYEGRACRVLSYFLFKEAFEVMWKTKLDTLQTRYPGMSGLEWKKLDDYNGTEDRFAHLYLFVDGQFESDMFRFRRNEFDTALESVINSPRFKDEISALVKDYEWADKKKAQRKLDKKQSWSHLTCLKVTTAIGEGAASVGRGLLKGGQLIKAFFVQLKTLLAYLWMLAKAKKQGACPYFVFTDPSKKAK